MLRMIVIALVVAAPGWAMAEQFPHSALQAEIRSDDGTVVGRVDAVERDGEGRIVAIESEALEPADAPSAAPNLVAEQRRDERLVLSRYEARESGGGAAARMR